MGLISVSNVPDGTQIDAGDVNNPINTIVNEFNGNIEDANLADGTISSAKLSSGAISSIIQTIYPVGAIYISTISTNPATLFGFGTWVAFGAGKTLIGLDSGDTDFDTAEETGGAKTHTHSTDSQGYHVHTLSSAGQAQILVRSTQIEANYVPSTAWGYVRTNSGGGTASGTNDLATPLMGSTDYAAAHTHSVLSGSSLPPYIVTYIWKRTA